MEKLLVYCMKALKILLKKSMTYTFYRNNFFILVSVFLLGACSPSSFKIVRTKPGTIQRGWSYMESEKVWLKMKAGIPALNFSSPRIYKNYLFYSSDRFGVMALNKNTGEVIWQKEKYGSSSSSVLLTKKTLFVGGDNGFYALKLESGAEIWRADLKFPTVGAPILAGGRIFVNTEDHTIHALDSFTGKHLWAFHRHNPNLSIKGGGNPLFLRGKIWVGFSDGSLVVLEPNDGSIIRESRYKDNPKFQNINAKPVAWKRGVFIVTYDGKLRYIKRNGSLIWKFPAGGAHSPLISRLTNRLVFLPSSDGHIYAIHEKTGKLRWKFLLPQGIPTGITIIPSSKKAKKKSNTLIVASSNNYIYAFNASNGKLLDFTSLGNSSGTYASIAKSKNNFYIVSHYGRVYQYHLQAFSKISRKN